MQLHGCNLKLRVQVFNQRYLLLAERHRTVIPHVVQEEEQIDQRHFVAGQIVARVAVFVLTRRVVREERLTCYGVHARNVGKFGVIHHVAELVAVYRVNIRNAESVVNLRAGLKLRDKLGFLLIAAGRDDDDHEIVFTEALMYGVRGDVLLVLTLGVDKIHGVGVIAVAEGEVCSDDEQHEQRRDYEPCSVREFASKVDLRHEVLVLRFIHELAAAHEQRWHQQKYRHQAAHDGLDESHAHVEAEAEFHKGHRREPRDGGQTAGGNFGDGHCERVDCGLAYRLCLVLFLIAIAVYYRVVHAQGELEDNGDGV